MKKTLMLAALLLVPMFAHADDLVHEVTISGTKFFEPTQADYNCCAKAIKVQQKMYQSAKEDKRWNETVDLALFHWTKAWAYFNWSMDTATSDAAWNDEVTLKDALDLMSLAATEATAADSKEGSRILKKCAKNSKWMTERIEQLHRQVE